MSARRKALRPSCATGASPDTVRVRACPTGIGLARSLWLGTALFLVLIVLCRPPAAGAADPQPYNVDMATSGDGDRDTTLRATSDLMNLRRSAPVGPFALIGRARGDVDRLRTVLESYGYYQSAVMI